MSRKLAKLLSRIKILREGNVEVENRVGPTQRPSHGRRYFSAMLVRAQKGEACPRRAISITLFGEGIVAVIFISETKSLYETTMPTTTCK